MTRKRRYQLLCPVARALDVLGDRWSLLILRDLHAGPARFQHLQEGLGMATNLLATRLGELTEAGLIDRAEDDRHGAYALTELGRSTDRMLWELVRFGSLVDRDPAPRTPGNLRTIALPLRMMLSAVPDRPTMTVRLLVDEETFTITVTPTEVDVAYGDQGSAVEAAPGSESGTGSEFQSGGRPDLILRTDYEGFLGPGRGSHRSHRIRGQPPGGDRRRETPTRIRSHDGNRFEPRRSRSSLSAALSLDPSRRHSEWAFGGGGRESNPPTMDRTVRPL